MKSLWHTAHQQEILRRLSRLSADAPGLWGSLTPHRAIVHLSDSLQMALGEIAEAPIPGVLRHQPIKWLAINVLPMPKGVKGPAGYFTNTPGDYDEDRLQLELLIRDCTSRPANQLWGENPFFGRLTKTQWGRLCYKHVDHHLRQFGC